MVKICSYTSYSDNDNQTKKEYFEKFEYPLYIFQKWAIHGIVEGHHVLVTAPTGSGKSLPAEFAIDFFHERGKKVIYCSPIKALSNQKFYDFTMKYPHITIGLITGDIKTNPDADVLIMTTEILLNKLYQLKSVTPPVQSSVSFDMDIENELACVIFDEIHMINDTDRGHVWENCIMMLPVDIQMLGLSATLDDPEKFAYWMENRGNGKVDKIYGKKEVYLSKKTERTIPLTHYAFLTGNSSVPKVIKDKATQAEIKKFTNHLHIIQSAKGVFNDAVYSQIVKYNRLFEQNKIRVTRSHVLNQVSRLLVEKDMLPALCYVFSRKQIDICAKELTVNLLEEGSKIPSIINHECEKIIRKLPNYSEYLELPEYCNLIKLMEKGVATHHSGMMPILREIVELMFTKGYIKMLFCTESVAIGLNLPVKTTIFTDINKHDGTFFRKLYGHEFVQASGRAGRLGLDTVGHVIHLHNMFRDMDSLSYKQMMMGKPQTLISKFKISYNLLLNLVNSGEDNLIEFAQKSMITGDLENEQKHLYKEMTDLNREIDNLNLIICAYRTPKEIVDEFLELETQQKITTNKKQKNAIKRLNEIRNEYINIEKEKYHFEKVYIKQHQLTAVENKFNQSQLYIKICIDKIINILSKEKFIQDNKLTIQGLIASNIKEVPCLVFAQIFENEQFTSLSANEMVVFLSCFTNLSIQEDMKEIIPKNCNTVLNKLLDNIQHKYQYYQELELQMEMETGTEYLVHFDLIKYVTKWCEANDVVSCKSVLNEMFLEKGIFLGEFTKALIKINNIAAEMEKVCELIGKIDLLSKLREIPGMTLKFVATNQSLYV
jgi:superfamily II RNA helicase